MSGQFCYLFTILGFYMNSLLTLTPVLTTYMSMSFSTSPKSPWLWTLDLPGATNAMETWAERRSKCYWGWTGALLVMPMQCHLDGRGGGVSLWIGYFFDCQSVICVTSVFEPKIELVTSKSDDGDAQEQNHQIAIDLRYNTFFVFLLICLPLLYKYIKYPHPYSSITALSQIKVQCGSLQPTHHLWSGLIAKCTQGKSTKQSGRRHCQAGWTLA